MNKFCNIILVSIFLYGCGSTPPPKLSPAHDKAIRQNESAHNLFIKGNYQKALSLFSDALKVSRSVEDVDGIATNLINVAATMRKLGQYDDAHLSLDEILNTNKISFSTIHSAEADYLKGLLYVDNEEVDKASPFLESGLVLCKKDECRSEGKIYNLRSRIALLKSEPQKAEELAENGLAINKKSDNLSEMANSYRLLGDTALAQNNFGIAIKYFEAALKLDKKLGLSSKIVNDLFGLGESFFGSRQFSEAETYYGRALTVSENGGGSEARKREIVEKIRRCEESLK